MNQYWGESVKYHGFVSDFKRLCNGYKCHDAGRPSTVPWARGGAAVVIYALRKKSRPIYRITNARSVARLLTIAIIVTLTWDVPGETSE